jgi:hypothetical protein
MYRASRSSRRKSTGASVSKEGAPKPADLDAALATITNVTRPSHNSFEFTASTIIRTTKKHSPLNLVADWVKWGSYMLATQGGTANPEGRPDAEPLQCNTQREKCREKNCRPRQLCNLKSSLPRGLRFRNGQFRHTDPTKELPTLGISPGMHAHAVSTLQHPAFRTASGATSVGTEVAGDLSGTHLKSWECSGERARSWGRAEQAQAENL